jgi:hypothetical protein
MQSPEQPANLVKFPAKTSDPIRHDFSPAQMEMIQHYRTQLAAAEKQAMDVRVSIGLFLDYVRKEKQLPAEGMEWSLSAGPDGKPFLAGLPLPQNK